MAVLTLELSSPLLRKRPHIFAETIKRLTEDMARLNIEAIKADARIPRLYASRVYYRMSIPEGVIFRDLYSVIRWGYGHCQHLTAWRLAELWAHGEDTNAQARVKWGRSLQTGRRIFHVLIHRGDDSEEDPSRRLGMGDSFVEGL